MTFLVDHTGTHRLTDQQAEIILGAPPGIEIYFAPLELSPTYVPLPRAS